MLDLPSDWESWFNGTFDISDPAWKDVCSTHDAGLCAGPSPVPGPISSERADVEYEPESTVDNSLNPPPNVGSSGLGLSSFLDVNFGFNSSFYDYGYQTPSFPFPDQPYVNGSLPLADNPLPVLGGLTHSDLAAPTPASYSPLATFDAPFSSVPSLDSTYTQSTSSSLLSQADTQHSRRLPLPPRGTSKFRCSLCASTFRLPVQLRYKP